MGKFFAQPYSDRKPPSLPYTLGYRGYDLEVARANPLWQVGIFPTHAELPTLRRCQVSSHGPDEAVLEAKRRVDALLEATRRPRCAAR
jgi:hypothetical protein